MNDTYEVVGETDQCDFPGWFDPGSGSFAQLALWALGRLTCDINWSAWPKIVRLTRDGKTHVATVDVMMHDDEPKEMPLPAISESAVRISVECEAIKQTLLAKNRAYGDSALDPVRIFSKADGEEQLRVRIDDKLSRLMRGKDAGEDVLLDLIGYLILLRVAKKGNQNESL